MFVSIRQTRVVVCCCYCCLNISFFFQFHSNDDLLCDCFMKFISVECFLLSLSRSHNRLDFCVVSSRFNRATIILQLFRCQKKYTHRINVISMRFLMKTLALRSRENIAFLSPCATSHVCNWSSNVNVPRLHSFSTLVLDRRETGRVKLRWINLWEIQSFRRVLVRCCRLIEHRCSLYQYLLWQCFFFSLKTHSIG